MRRAILLGCLFLGGCQNLIGPFQHREPQRVDDPLLSIPEQQRRGRDQLALPEDKIGPPTYANPPGLYGR
jgi:hypothetical protein